MSSSSQAQARRSVAEDVLADVGKSKVRTTSSQQSQTKSSIESNAAYQIMFSENLSPEDKKNQLEALHVVVGSKEQDKQRTKEYNEFKEWLQEQRRQMAQEVIRLTNTETFSQLQLIYNELGNGINDFDRDMSPLTEIVEALYKLRMKGETLSAFKEIAEQNKLREELTVAFDKLTNDKVRLEVSISSIEDEILVLQQERGFFGFGDIKQSARVEIARKEKQLADLRANKVAAESELTATKEKLSNVAFTGELAREKAKLKELLDLTGDQHKHRVEKLVNSANGFVDKASNNISVIRSQLSGMTDQVDNLFTANSDMSRVYAILEESEKGAEKKNAEIRQTLSIAKTDETAIERLTREEKKMIVEDKITALQDSSVDTTATFADLQRQAISVKGMRDSLNTQMGKARTMATRGVAGVSERLSSVVTAVAQAAINESSAFAGDAMTAMRDSTNRITMQETIKNAMGLGDINDELEKALGDLGQFTEVQKQASEIARENLTSMRDLTARMQEQAKETASAVQESLGIAADTFNGTASADKKSAPTNSTSPFGLRKA